MKPLKHILAICLLFTCLINIVACGEEPATITHTHSFKVRHIDGVDCQSYGYEETYCEFCDYVTRVTDTETRPHNYNIFWTTDIETTEDAVGMESRHCEWHHLCGKSIDSRPIEQRSEEDLTPKPF